METGSSVLPERSQVARNIVERRTITLDTLLEKRKTGNAKESKFIKLDVQGFELEVLKGSQCTLRSTEVLLLEVSLLEINEGCPRFGEVIAWLNNAGFVLFDVCHMLRRLDGCLWQMDLLFVCESSGLVPEARLTFENWGSAKIRSGTDLSIPPSLRT